MQHERPASIVVVNDERTLRAGIVAALRQGGSQVAEFERAEAALQHLRAHDVSAIVLDWTNPPLDKVVLYRRLRREHPGLAIVYVSPHDDCIGEMLADEPSAPEGIIGTPDAMNRIAAMIEECLAANAGKD